MQDQNVYFSRLGSDSRGSRTGGRKEGCRSFLTILLALCLLLTPTLATFAGELRDDGSGVHAPTVLAISQPDGTNDVVAEGDDYAERVWLDAWDMNEITDIYNEKTQNINSSAGANRMAINSGVLEGTTTTDDPSFFLLYPGFANVGIDSPGKYGVIHPIDAAKYTRLTFRMYLSTAGAGDKGMLIWYKDATLDFAQKGGVSNFFDLKQGWNTYSLDLNSLGWQIGLPWGGQVQGLRLDPTTAARGVDVKIDWVRLTPGSGTETSYPVTYSGGSGSMDLYSDTDTNSANGYTGLIAQGVNAGGSSYTWDSVNLPDGEYFVAAVTGAGVVYSPGKLTIKQSPILKLTQPSMTSGPDYATVTFGNPWDFDSMADVDDTAGLTNPRVEGGILRATTTANGDPQLFMRTGYNFTTKQTATPINADKYRFVTYRFRDDGKDGRQDTTLGWVSRFVWYNQDIKIDFGQTKDLVFNEGWNEITIDLSKTQIEANSQAGWTSNKQVFRFDLDEIEFPAQIYVDDVKLTAIDESNTGSFTIKWAGTYAPDTVIDLYYDTDLDPAVKTEITTGVAATAGQHVWNTSAVPFGTYNIYLVARDGNNSVGRYSESPVILSVNPANLPNKIYLPLLTK